MGKDGSGIKTGICISAVFQLFCASRSQTSADASKVSMHLTTEVADFFYFFSYFFSLFYTFANTGRCNRKGLYDAEYVKSLVMTPSECYH